MMGDTSMLSNKPPRPSRKKRPPRGNNRRGAGPPPAQQMKVTLRNIQDADRYGTVAQILVMALTIIQKVNSENKNRATFLPMVLEEASVQRLIEAEELAAAAAKNVANANANANAQQETVTEEHQHGGDHEHAEAIKDEPMQVKDGKNPRAATIRPESNIPNFASIVRGAVDPGPPNVGPVMNVRALYVVPPKKSRRRGIKGGCAYFILTGPTASEEDESSTALTFAQRSHATAKARLQLLMAVEALSKHAQEDATSNQLYAGCVVQPSDSGKAWKPAYRDQYREGTVESTGDYKKFIANMAKEEEERTSRPRPTPGGAWDDPKLENGGEPVAAIVKYLCAKRQQETRRKVAARKKIATSVGYDTKGKKKNSTSTSTASSNNNNNKRGQKPKKERPRGGRNPKKVGNGTHNSMTAPVLLKSSGGEPKK